MTSSGEPFSLHEDFNGALSLKQEFYTGNYNAYLNPDSSSPIGWTFHPGSNVVIRNDSGIVAAAGSVSFFGYLAR